MPPKTMRSRGTPGLSADESSTSKAGRTSLRQAAKRVETVDTQEQSPHTGFVVPKQRVARRGAKQQGTAKSVASIATNVNQADNDEMEEDQEMEEPTEPTEPTSSEVVEVAQVAENAAEATAQPELDANMMISFRDVLFSSADTLFGHLVNHSNEASWEMMLEAHRGVFANIRQFFTTPGSRFLDLEHIKNALKKTDTSDALLLPSVVSAANLAILMDTLGRIATDHDELAVLLRQLDEDFPWCIVAPESARADKYKEFETFDRARDIRVTRWGLAMAAESDMNVEKAANFGCELFLETVPESSTMVHLTALDAPLKPISDFDFKEADEAEAKEKVIDDIKIFWNSVAGENGADLQLDDFKVRFAGWTNEFLDEITKWTMSLFGAVKETVMKSRPRTDGAVHETDEVENQLMQETEASQKVPARRGNKSLFKGSGSIRAVSAATGRKRKRGHDADPGEITPKNPKRRVRRSTAVVPPQTPPKEAESTQKTVGQSVGEGEEQAGVEKPATQAEVANGEQPMIPQGDATNGNGDSRPVEESQTAEGDVAPPAKREQAALSSTPDIEKSRAPKKRVFWTPNETQAIIDLVRDYGSFWSGMETQARRQNLFSVPRTQQHIRDKARNIKLDLIRRDQLLPEGFDRVLFSAKEERMLRKLNKNPDRREADVDGDGHPTNTTYIAGQEE